MTEATALPLALYVHLPWCVRKCPYCDFNSHALRGELPQSAYIEALLRDAEHDAHLSNGRAITSVFIGGGTPSLFDPANIAALLTGLDRRLGFAADAEITLEANPGTLESHDFVDFRAAGVNRLSLGVQSFHAGHLQRLGRIHDGDSARAAVRAAGRAFERFNVDLMVGLPEQTVAEAERDVDEALELGARHVSHYQLTLEPGTAFHARPPALPDEDRIMDMQTRTGARLTDAGLRRYEISAWSEPGAECRHNLNYWRFGDYLGVGAGAHGKITDGDVVERYSKRSLPRDFMQCAGSSDAVATRAPVAWSERPVEFMMNALRLTEGVPRAWMTERTRCPESAFQPALDTARERGWLSVDARLRPTVAGQRFLDDLVGLFLP